MKKIITLLMVLTFILTAIPIIEADGLVRSGRGTTKSMYMGRGRVKHHKMKRTKKVRRTIRRKIRRVPGRRRIRTTRLGRGRVTTYVQPGAVVTSPGTMAPETTPSPAPETTTPETTSPEVTPPETTAPETTPSAAMIQNIDIKDISFQPNSVTVQVGTTVTWTNRDSFTHTVTSGMRDNPTNMFDSGNIDPNGTFSFTFTTPGTYPYFCKIHTNMSGTVIVQ